MLNARYHCEACGWEGEGPQVAHDLSRWHVPEPVQSYWACPECSHEVQATVKNEAEALRQQDKRRREQRGVHRTTRHPVDFLYTRQELEALFRHAREHDVEQGGRYDARSAAVNIWSHHWADPATREVSETIGSLYFHWAPTPRLWEIETDEGVALEDLMQELGRLELSALGYVKHGHVPRGGCQP